MTLEVSFTTEFDPRLENLRRECFPGEYPTGSAKDHFDDRCIHIFIFDKDTDEIAANGRICPGPNGFFEEWIQGPKQIPTGADVADLGRCFVSPKYRGLRLLHPLCLLGVKYSEVLGFRHVVGAAIPESHVARMLIEFGFVKSGSEVIEQEPSGLALRIQPLVCDLKTTKALRAEKMEAFRIPLSAHQKSQTVTLYSPA